MNKLILNIKTLNAKDTTYMNKI